MTHSYDYNKYEYVIHISYTQPPIWPTHTKQPKLTSQISVCVIKFESKNSIHMKLVIRWLSNKTEPNCVLDSKFGSLFIFE